VTSLQELRPRLNRSNRLYSNQCNHFQGSAWTTSLLLTVFVTPIVWSTSFETVATNLTTISLRLCSLLPSTSHVLENLDLIVIMSAVADENTTINVDESPISPIERRNSLEKHLQHRPDVQDLKNRHILLDTTAAPCASPFHHAPRDTTCPMPLTNNHAPQQVASGQTTGTRACASNR
jgi:hypothetical protein